MAYHKGRGIMFGGVHDVEESEEGIDSEFFNGLYAWNIERNRYFQLSLRKPRANANQRKFQETRGGRRGRGQANEDELLRNLAALQTGKSLADANEMDIEKPPEDTDEKQLPAKEVLQEFPHARFNAQLTVQVSSWLKTNFDPGNGIHSSLGSLNGPRTIVLEINTNFPFLIG
jgi:hypothetical protein